MGLLGMSQRSDQDLPATSGAGSRGKLGQPPMLYQSLYTWLVFVASLDILFTWAVLRLGGVELNFLADAVISWAGLHGMIVFKFCTVVFVVLMCEFIGRQRYRLGRRIAILSVAITWIPVVLGIVQTVIEAQARVGR